jgi:hypothetical protein
MILLIFLLLVPVVAQAQDDLEWVLPKVTPEKIEALLDLNSIGQSTKFLLEDANIEKTIIKVSYASEAYDDLIEIDLVHFSDEKADYRTKKFGLRVLTRADDDRVQIFIKRLLQNIRQKEHDWIWLRKASATTQDTPFQYVSNTFLLSINQWMAVYLILVLLLGVYLNAWFDRRKSPSLDVYQDRRAFDKYDLCAVLIVILAIALRWYGLAERQIWADESNNLEHNFWANWFFNWETRRNPPIFRMLIHLTPGNQIPMWINRLPALIFGVLNVGLMYTCVRKNAPGIIALLAAGFLCLYPFHIELSQMQRSYTLWFCFLFLAQHEFGRALGGNKKGYSGYALWSMLAVMTHYLTVFFLAGHFLMVVFGYRKNIIRYLGALLPSVIAFLPFGIMILATWNEGSGPQEQSWLEGVVAQVDWLIMNDEIVGILIVILSTYVPVGSSSRAGLRGALWLFVVYILGIVIIGIPGKRYASPIVPLGILLVSERLGDLSFIYSQKHNLLLRMGRFALLLIGCFSLIYGTYHAGNHDWFERRGVRLTMQAYKNEIHDFPSYVALYPLVSFDPVSYEFSHRRDHWNTDCQGPGDTILRRFEDRIIFGVDDNSSAARLEHILDYLGQFDFIYLSDSSSGRSKNMRIIGQWLEKNCYRLLMIGNSPGRHNTVYRCQTGPQIERSVHEIKEKM